MTAPLPILVVALLVMCTGAPPAVHIVEPASGAVLPGPAVRVVLEATGIEIAPVAEHRAGTAHNHLFLDVDVSPAHEPIPGGPGVVHLGGGQTEFTFDSVAPGRHRLIAVLGDPKHVPIENAATDTVMFTVGAP